jgi:hypothetical protein
MVEESKQPSVRSGYEALYLKGTVILSGLRENPDICEIRSFSVPPPPIFQLFRVILRILGSEDVPSDWRAIVRILNEPPGTMSKLRNFFIGFDYINSQVLEAINPILQSQEMKLENMKRMSFAGFKLLEWVLCLVEITRAKGH